MQIVQNIKQLIYHASNIKLGIAEILLNEGYIKSYEEIKDDAQGIIRITLKYDEKGTRVIDGLKRISKPGLKSLCI